MAALQRSSITSAGIDGIPMALLKPHMPQLPDGDCSNSDAEELTPRCSCSHHHDSFNAADSAASEALFQGCWYRCSTFAVAVSCTDSHLQAEG